MIGEEGYSTDLKQVLVDLIDHEGLTRSASKGSCAFQYSVQ